MPTPISPPISRVPETKVLAGLLGTTGGAVIGKLLLWLIGAFLFKVPFDAPHTEDAIAAVPQPLGDAVWLAVTLAVGAIAAYYAPHTLRPDLQSPPDPQVVNQPEAPAPAVPEAPVAPVAPPAPAVAPEAAAFRAAAGDAPVDVPA